MRILVVDDSQTVCMWCRVHLQGIGFEVTELRPGAVFEVLAALRESRPDLLITDYEMPHCNGESLIRAIREDPEVGQTPILVFSSHREAELVHRLSQWRLAGYLVKPASVETFLLAVLAALRHHREPLPEAAQAFLVQRQG